MAFRVAVVGTEGTGKTVLMTVWAKAFLRQQRGISLIPQTHDTAVFVSRNWEYLTRGDWPPSTREGSLVQLKWELKIPETPACNVEFREISGQDFRNLFGDSAVYQQDALPKPLQALVDNLAQTDICILLVNLADFAGQSDIETREKSQWAIKSSLDWLREKNPNRKCLLLFTQSDLYATLKEELGGWTEVAKKYLPYVYTSHIVTGQVDILAVSAVGNTRVVFADDGTPRRVPDTQWHCRGLITMTQWIGRRAARLMANDSKRQPAATQAFEAANKLATHKTATNQSPRPPISEQLAVETKMVEPKTPSASGEVRLIVDGVIAAHSAINEIVNAATDVASNVASNAKAVSKALIDTAPALPATATATTPSTAPSDGPTTSSKLPEVKPVGNTSVIVAAISATVLALLFGVVVVLWAWR